MKPAVPTRPVPTLGWVIVLGSAVVLGVLFGLLGSWIGLTGVKLWVFRVGLWLLMLAAAALVIWFLRSRSRRTGGESHDELDSALATARSRLATVGKAGTRGFARRPMVVVIGPTGSAKTTSIVHCGLEPDLVAGAVYQGDQIGPTTSANIWYAQDTVVVEAGGALLAAPSAWARLVRAVKPPRLAAALTGRPQAPRAAVVCFPIDAFLQPDAAQAVPQAARELRAGLQRLARTAGVQLPVYVWFTKLDRMPFFADFVAHLTREEAWDALGAALRWPEHTTAGLYAEREFQRVGTAFQQVLDALAAKRLDLLARETDQTRQGSAYEFPRELRKLEGSVVQFLVELCRPRHLATSPVLRGFYFTGVRAVLVHDAAAPPPEAARGGRRRRATAVFEGDIEAAPTAPASSGRRVPEWVFLGRVTRDVVLRDRAAAAVAQRGAGVGVIRRALLATAAALAVILGLGFLTSFVNNRRLGRDVVAVARALPQASVSDPGVPDAETLTALDAMRGRLARLERYRTEGRPLRLKWGLYTGSSLAEAAAPLYRDRVQRLLILPARAALIRALRALPDTGSEGGDYGRTYDLLRAYLMITSRTDRLDAGMLVPVLLEQWLDGRQLDPERTDLARAQLAYYAGPLCRDGLCAAESEDALVERGRALLRRYAGPERIYRLMVARAGEGLQPVRFSQAFPAASSVLTDPHEVPPAYTVPGWTAMNAAFDRVDEFLRAEDWVVGEGAPLQIDRTELVGQLRQRYAADYRRHWTTFLSSAAVAQFGGLSDAGRKLRQLSGNESPLLQLLALASRHTAVDSVAIGRTFRAVQVVVPPGVTDTYIGESNQGYMNALIALGNLVEQAAGASPGEAEGLTDQTLQGARTAKDAVRQLALTFPAQGDAGGVSAVVQRLMETPVSRIEGMVGRLPTTAINSRGAAFCAPFRQLTSRYPFNPTAVVEVSYDEVAAALLPNSGALWQFYTDYLQGSLVLQGTRYAQRVGGPVPLTADFVRFFNRAAAVSRSLWPAGDTARVDFVFKPQLSDGVPGVSLSVDGYTGRWTRTATAQRPFSWVGPRASDVQLTAQVRGRDVTLAHRGTWALFRLFQQGEWRGQGTTGVIRWQLDAQGENVVLEAEVGVAGAAVFERSFFAGLTCVSRVAR